MSEIISYLLSSAVIGGLIISFIKSYLDNLVNKARIEREEREKQEIKYRLLVQTYLEAYNDFVVWLYKDLTLLDPDHEIFNGGLKSAYNEVIVAKSELDKFKNEIVAKQKF